MCVRGRAAELDGLFVVKAARKKTQKGREDPPAPTPPHPTHPDSFEVESRPNSIVNEAI